MAVPFFHFIIKNMLSQYLKKVNNLYGQNKKECILALIIFLVGIGSFEFGRLSSIGERGTISISKEVYTSSIQIPHPSSTITAQNNTGAYVASKSGSLYYTPTCSGASRIKEENKVWFQTKEAAEARGYKTAHCDN